MRMYDLIEEKKRGETLSDQEIAYMIRGFTKGEGISGLSDGRHVDGYLL